ncbi:hypothetical protein [Paraburkholderia sp. J8-2]|uniref:hypothetical protein n=1 Tax=Paraburkholderia sp. J8-2 TaxID=2805440 RepID=UPI002AB69E96|nr:hypothetical protein [Paraburkholderia sp. J8-2]
MNDNQQTADLTDPACIEQHKSQWRVLPKSMIVIEFHGTGDAFFGGSADDRALGTNGRIKENARDCETARFATIEEAHAAALLIPNRRQGSSLGVAPTWR